MKKNSINIIWIYVNLLFFIIGFIFYDNNNFYIILSLIGAIQLISSIIIYKKSGENLLSPLIIYVIVMYLFLFGQCLMWLITKNFDGRSIIQIYSKNEIIKAQIFTLFCFFFFHLACFNVNNSYVVDNSSLNNKIYNAISMTGLFLLFFSFIPEIIYNVRLFIIAYTQGYMGIYSNQASGLFLKFLTLREFFFPSLVLIYVGDYKNNKLIFIKKLLTFIIIIDVLIGFYVGSRADAIMQLLVLLLLKNTLSNNNISRISYVKYAIVLFALLSIINVVRVVRIESNKTISSYINAIASNTHNGLITSTMGEMGGSMSTCIETMNLVPNYFPYKYGTSYLYSFTWLLPASISGDLIEKASMNNWIDSVRYTGSGWGFSTTGEAFYNFGYYGVFVFLIFGFFVGKFFKGLNHSLILKKPLELALSFILFSRLLIFSRIDFLSTLPSIFYFYICIKIIVILFYLYLNRWKEKS